MDFTPILKLSLPPFDDIPWDEAINGNFSVIDAAVGRFYNVPNLVGIWQNSTSYLVGQAVIDNVDSSTWSCNVMHTSAVAPTTFAATRAANPSYWTSVTATAQAYAIAAAASATAAANSASTAAATAASNVGRNLLHNSRMTIQQRGVGPWSTTGAYTADRWRMDFTGGTMFSNISSYTDANRVTIGDESATVFLAATVVGGAGAGDFAILSQFIEGVSRLAGKTVTISFWANASAGTPKLGVGVRQSFGTGGSPSANVDVAGQSVTLSATPARYTLTFAVPSMAGKTFGSNPDTAYTRIAFALSSGTTNAAIFGTPGVQSATVALWGTQLEFGSAATALESRDRALELTQCQRFYQVANIQLYGYQAASNIIAMAKTLTVTMRIAPSIVYQPSVATNVTGAGVNALGGDAVNVFGTATATGPANIQGIYLASADY